MVAKSVTSAPAPKAPTSGPVSSTPRTVPTSPMPTASQMPSMPWASAPSGVTGADVPGHARRGPVGEEDAQADDGLENHRGDALAGELGRAEVADDRGVREQEQRLGHQRQEGGYGEPQDLPVVGARHRANLANPPE